MGILERRGRTVIAVIFEVWPRSEHRQAYLDLAAQLRPLLDSIEGFIAIERFESLTSPGKILSLSFWRDEQAVERWRKLVISPISRRICSINLAHDWLERCVEAIFEKNFSCITWFLRNLDTGGEPL